ncbi:hypothetical protein THICB3180036 [Thiomonas sp. CB3]|nr:hypothetical protein THICB3180036 [Thiomonas sp. CB3]
MPRCSYRLLASFFSHCWSSLSDILADPGAARQYFNGLLGKVCTTSAETRVDACLITS